MPRTSLIPLMILCLLPACSPEPATPASTSAPATPDWRAKDPAEYTRQLDQAKDNAKTLRAAVLANDPAAANALKGKLVRLTGTPTAGGRAEWLFTTFKQDGALTVKALISRNTAPAATPLFRVREISAVGPLQAIDLATKTVTLEDADLVLDVWAGR